jgi:hypothetical protein
MGLAEDFLSPGTGEVPERATEPNLQIHRIEPLSWNELAGEPRPEKGPSAREEMYAGPPIRRTVAKSEVSVTELCGHLDPVFPQQPASAKPNARTRRLPGIDADALLKELDLEGRFGILTHQLLARWDPDPAAAPPEPDWSGIPKEHREALLGSAVSLCRNFFDSELGALSRQAERVDRELPFLYLYEDEQGPLYINGRIDLAFQLRDRLYLVDFKTDRNYQPGEHECQLAMYRLALAEQTEAQIHTFLFLLRSGQGLHCPRSIDPAQWIPRIRHLL